MLANIPYCPLLYSRVAEVKALFQLPAAAKDRMFPVIVARPWPNAKQLSRTWEKLQEAFGLRRFGLDLDSTKRDSSSEKSAAAEFSALFDRTGGYRNYYNLLEIIPQAIPVLRIDGGVGRHFDEQAGHVDRLDRGLIVRLQHGQIINPLELASMVLDRFEDVVFFVDAGWSTDLLSREIWASQIIKHISDERPEAEIVVSGSSFPDSFTDIVYRGVIPVHERSLHSNLSRRHNAAHLIYGDWGSTRPPSTEQIPMRNTPRIDLPTSGEWLSFRRDKQVDEDEDYPGIARRMIDDRAWPADLNIWGTYTIECTAEQLPGAIRNAAVAAAARINIHLHRQAFFGANASLGDQDEPFTDD